MKHEIESGYGMRERSDNKHPLMLSVEKNAAVNEGMPTMTDDAD